MDDLSWMNWGGWRWLAPFFGMAIGFWMGWSQHAFHARMKALADRKTRAAVGLVEWLASCTDPFQSSDLDEEVAAFAQTIETAKTICGDLSEDVGGHP